ncbi:MAG: hypothetical protein QME87_00920 [Bacillota bacterium]|nr:hypothetical protein [Bacillota bacterium]
MTFVNAGEGVLPKLRVGAKTCRPPFGKEGFPMGVFDRVVLLATGLAAAYLVWFFAGEHGRAGGDARHNVY